MPLDYHTEVVKSEVMDDEVLTGKGHSLSDVCVENSKLKVSDHDIEDLSHADSNNSDTVRK